MNIGNFNPSINKPLSQKQIAQKKIEYNINKFSTNNFDNKTCNFSNDQLTEMLTLVKSAPKKYSSVIADKLEQALAPSKATKTPTQIGNAQNMGKPATPKAFKNQETLMRGRIINNGVTNGPLTFNNGIIE